HYVKLHETGVKVDCGSSQCALSKAHRHTARNCGCPRTYQEIQRIQNLYRTRCPACESAAWKIVERESGRQY
ncbi:hypothetical protein POSPLADRAFT_1144760, partial [Postia placenta MAD-698-R-SB12]